VPDLNEPAGAPTIPYLAAAADDSNRVFLATQQGAVTMVDLRTSPATLTPLFSSLQGLGGLTWMGRGDGGGATPVSDLPVVPTELVLGGAAPNPFNPRTTVRFELPRSGRATLELFDVRGRLVTTLVDADLAAGRHEVVWRGADAEGRAVASGPTWPASARAARRARPSCCSPAELWPAASAAPLARGRRRPYRRAGRPAPRASKNVVTSSPSS
jgi:hypothetical protein